MTASNVVRSPTAYMVGCCCSLFFNFSEDCLLTGRLLLKRVVFTACTDVFSVFLLCLFVIGLFIFLVDPCFYPFFLLI